jgi:hypothetical protein
MIWKRLTLVFILWTCAAGLAFSAECGGSPAKEIDIDLWSKRSLSSPDQRWLFVSVGPNSSEKKAALYIQDARNSRKWNVGSIERNGTAFWSEDSKRLFLRDEFAADDTRVRVFDVNGPLPREIKGLDQRIRKTIFAHIPLNKTTQYLYYPQVCFAADDSSMIILIADAPVVPKTESGSGRPFSLNLTVNLMTFQILATENVERSNE